MIDHLLGERLGGLLGLRERMGGLPLFKGATVRLADLLDPCRVHLVDEDGELDLFHVPSQCLHGLQARNGG